MRYSYSVMNSEMKKITILILGCILLTKNISAVHFLNCTKDDPRVLGYKFNCIISGNYNDTNSVKLIAALPDEVLDTAEIVDIKPSTIFTFLLNNTDIFRKFPIIRVLSFSNLFQFSLSEELKKKPIQHLQRELFDLPFLESLSIPNAQLDTNQHSWILPEEVVFLNLSNNRYTEYNLQNNLYLEVVDFTNNSLTELPTFYHPLRSLRELHLSDNPLDKVTVEHIANLCALEKLSLERTSFEANDPERYCECRKLKRWLKFLENWMQNEHYRGRYTKTKFGGEINCHKNNDVVCQDIIGSKYTLKEAYKLREICLTGRTDPIEYGFNFPSEDENYNHEDPLSMEDIRS